MKKIVLMLAVLATGMSAQAGFKILTNEDVVKAVLSSPELATEKQNNSYLNSMPLKSISISAENGGTSVYLTYSNGGAPCSVKAEMKAVNTVPAGAAGVNMVAQVASLRSACAMN